MEQEKNQTQTQIRRARKQGTDVIVRVEKKSDIKPGDYVMVKKINLVEQGVEL